MSYIRSDCSWTRGAPAVVFQRNAARAPHFHQKCGLCALTLLLLACCVVATRGFAANPPPGFVALFNGQDLSGWRGGATYDHRQLLALSPAERDAQIAKWTSQLTEPKDGRPHWRNIFIREIGPDEANRLLAQRDPRGFEPIFNGRDLDGWAGAVQAVDIQEGAMRWRPAQGGTLYWNTELADFQVRLMFTLPPGGNNGLAIRYPGKGDVAYDAMCELQVIDDNYHVARKLPPERRLDPRQYHGSAYGMVAAAHGYQRPIGEWNFQEVTVHGSKIRVELNGTVILDTDLAEVDMSTVMGNKPHPGKDRRSGFFGFAGHRDPVAFRDIRVRRL